MVNFQQVSGTIPIRNLIINEVCSFPQLLRSQSGQESCSSSLSSLQLSGVKRARQELGELESWGPRERSDTSKLGHDWTRPGLGKPWWRHQQLQEIRCRKWRECVRGLLSQTPKMKKSEKLKRSGKGGDTPWRGTAKLAWYLTPQTCSLSLWSDYCLLPKVEETGVPRW